MIEWLRTWFLSLIGATLVLTVLCSLLPDRPIRTVARSISAIILVVVLLRPLLGARFDRLALAYDSAQQSIDEQVEAYEQHSQDQYEELIAQQTAAYIQDRGAAYGLSCRAEVTVQWQDGVPLPYAVTLDIENSPDLSDEITQQLGIPPERQYWEGGA